MSHTNDADEVRYECPMCETKLAGPVRRRTETAASPRGPKSPSVEVVVCPGCGEVIDGFRAH